MEDTDHVALLGQATAHSIDVLIEELEALSSAWKKRLQKLTRLERKELPDPIPGLHDFVVSVKGTANSVQRLLRNRIAAQSNRDFDDKASQEEQDIKDMIKLESCGLVPHQLLWDGIKRTHGLLAFRRRFSGSKGKLGPTIDAVVENGVEWFKVLTVTEKKLHIQMAEEGWHPDDSSDDECDESEDEESGIQIIKITNQLVKAARANRCNTRIPRIRLVLPNLVLGRDKAIDKLLESVRAVGISKQEEGDVEILIDCANSTFLERPIPPLEQVFENMFRDTAQDRLTSTLNLELTIILSLVSDIAHGEVAAEEWYSRQTLSHIEDELHAPGVRLQNVYSALRGRRLECTQEVAREVRNIVDDLGTETTKTRTMLWFGRKSITDGFDTPRSPALGTLPSYGTTESEVGSGDAERGRLVSELRKLSKYPVPDDLQLPIRIIGDDEFDHADYQALIEAGQLPPVAAQVWAKLDRSYNRSSHLMGWLHGNTTVSANALNVRTIEATVDKERTSPLEVGPKLYLTPLAISINTARPCPTDKWNEIKVSKHLRKEARSKEAKHLKAAGTWGPSLGIPIKWDEKQVEKQHTRRKKGERSNGSDTQHRCPPEGL
ncbi:hypothetical protein N0V82_003324 [Gnomoniopsis sp. IMI 355080]|nr:hypothetical protein N0V82_003324 [Gnomoniopsis sp. IMI 355080]